MKINRFILSCLLASSLVACKEPKENTDKNDKVVAKREPEVPKIIIDEYATLRAQMMAGIEPSNKMGLDSIFNLPATKQHYQEFNSSWENLETKHLSKLRAWRDSEMKDMTAREGSNLFYPFSGPDFLNVYTFFPNCDNYLMFGLEQPGQLPGDLSKLPAGYLQGIRSAIATIMERNYFITSEMGNKLWGKGVLPIVNIFMARTGNKIVKIERFYLEKDGTAKTFPLEDEKGVAAKGKEIVGITIEFINEKRTKTQRIYYVGSDVADEKMKSKMELVTFINSFKNKMAFIKSASYILHNTNFATMRNIVLQNTDAVLQDDTGVRYKDFVDGGWKVDLYGKYARAVADFGGYTYQPAAAEAFKKDSAVKKIDFTFGYHWKTDHTSLFIARKK